ncbi:MAG: carbamoyltransferase HypF, partial [Desulfomonile sp.]|nr:carbamoyltransferase HypF [Desulfomonile sp.]
MIKVVSPSVADTPGPAVRRRMHLTGVLQGIGCRPSVYRLAVRLGLAGWVVNTTSGVIVEIEGTERQCREFEDELPGAIPFPGRIDAFSVHDVPALGETDFRIEISLDSERTITPIPPDVAVCPECVRELFDPENHRYLYPFITCTLCGPRFTVVRSFPYDRERTSMADFTMCDECRREYEDPRDRRFHSQTNSCPRCGPSLKLTDGMGRPLDGDPLLETIRLLAEGSVVAIKGIGGFHLACDALNEDAVSRLRERKGREEKPFAVMMPDMETMRRFCEVDDAEKDLLTSPISPIVLLRARGNSVAANVAPYVQTLGVMLPYSPMHHLLFRHPSISSQERLRVLVMTSGNRSEEPIARDNTEALERLGDLADAFLFHNRDIVLRADDSIFRVIAGRPTVFRRSRGIVPAGFSVGGGSDEARVILAAGGDLKNVPAIVKGNHAVPGPHVGDLATPVAQEYFAQSVSVLKEYLEAEPTLVAVDPHPEYFSNMLARGMGLEVEQVFHHHAHAVSLLFEHGMDGPAIFAVFDGTGYGEDRTIWGGEFLFADRATFSRVGHIGLFPLPGGEAAIREPIRILAGLLTEDGELPSEFSDLLGPDARAASLWVEAVRRGINAPLTSSAGRLFDAAAAAAGFRRRVTFEGEAAMWLEGIADLAET